MVEIPSDGKIKSDTRKLHQNNCGNTEKLQSLRKNSNCFEKAGDGTSKLDRYRIPPDLIYSLFLE